MTSSKIPPRTPEDVRRLMDLLLAEPSVSGCLHDLQPGALEVNYSGATFLFGAWSDPAGGTMLDGEARGTVEPQPAIVKLGATEREVRCIQQLAQHAPDLVPTLFAAGHRLGDEPLSWMVMERCPLRLDYGWGDHLFTTLLDAGVRFQLASRRLLPPVGPADVGANRVVTFLRDGDAGVPSSPGPTDVLFERFEEDWAWALASCRIELCHGDLHPSNAVWRIAPPDPAGRALLIDPAPQALPWVYEPAYCQVLYWPAGCQVGKLGLVQRMASIRQSYGLDVPDSETLARLEALFLAWHALRFWSHLTHRQGDPQWIADVRRWIERGAAR